MGRHDHIVFIFTYKMVNKTIHWKDGRGTEHRKDGKWTMHGAYDDDIEDAYKKVKCGKKGCLVKAIVSWSMMSGIFLAQIDGLKITGFPYGFDLYELLRQTHFAIRYLPDYTQIINEITMFVQRYHMGLVELEN